MKSKASERLEIRLDDTNVVAAAQIAGWLAFPDRPQYGINIVQQWWLRRKKDRGEDLSGYPIKLEKPSRLQPKIYTFNSRLRRTLRAGEWLNKRVALEAHRRGLKWNLGKGLRQLARDEATLPFKQVRMDEPNAITAYWTKNLPVLPLAKSTAYAIVEALVTDGTDGWHLERILFKPDWVDEAISNSENTAEWAHKMNIISLDKTIHFYRD